MELAESCRHYLTHYYLLEQTREETKRFLEQISTRLSALVREHLKLKDSSTIAFEEYSQKDGGNIWFTLKIQHDVPRLKPMGDWKYAIAYQDAMRTQDLSAPTKCKIFGFTAKSNSAKISELKQMATVLNLPDPYRVTEVDLIDGPVDDVVDNLARVFVGYYDDYVRIAQALTEGSAS